MLPNTLRMRRLSVPPEPEPWIALVAMDLFASPAVISVPPFRGPGRAKGREKAARVLLRSRQLLASYETSAPIRSMRCATAHHFPELWCGCAYRERVGFVKRGRGAGPPKIGRFS